MLGRTTSSYLRPLNHFLVTQSTTALVRTSHWRALSETHLHLSDLVKWDIIGHALTRPSQTGLFGSGGPPDGGQSSRSPAEEPLFTSCRHLGGDSSIQQGHVLPCDWCPSRLHSYVRSHLYAFSLTRPTAELRIPGRPFYVSFSELRSNTALISCR